MNEKKMVEAKGYESDGTSIPSYDREEKRSTERKKNMLQLRGIVDCFIDGAVASFFFP